MSDEQAYATMRGLRWDGGVPVCPYCKAVGAYEINATQTRKDGTRVPRPLFKCKAKGCRRQFTVTSGTLLHSHKLPIKTHLLAIFLFSRGAKGRAALQLSLELRTEYKTAFVLAHKMREAMAAEQGKLGDLKGTVEADLAFFGGYVKPKNVKHHRVDRRKKEFRSDSRKAMMAMVQCRGFVRVFEVINESLGEDVIRANLVRRSRIYTDAAAGWNDLVSHSKHETVNHSHEYALGG